MAAQEQDSLPSMPTSEATREGNLRLYLFFLLRHRASLSQEGRSLNVSLVEQHKEDLVGKGGSLAFRAAVKEVIKRVLVGAGVAVAAPVATVAGIGMAILSGERTATDSEMKNADLQMRIEKIDREISRVLQELGVDQMTSVPEIRMPDHRPQLRAR